MWDLLIQNGTVIDGTGADGFAADVAVKAGRIAAVGRLTGPAKQTVDARGMTVTPGFIDIHRHGDLAAFRPGFGELELRQGLTTVVNGNCGMSAAPFGQAHRREILDYLVPVLGEGDVPGDTVARYLDALEQVKLPVNVGTLAGGGVLRADAAGLVDAPLTDGDYDDIHRAMERALSDGALGISLGLGYAPECFYTTQQLIRALAPLAGGDVPVTAHMRDEGSGVDKSVSEMIEVARALRCPVHISHLKAMGRPNWGVKIPGILAMLDGARQEGLDITWDVYPYTAGSTQLLHILPPEVLSGGAEAACKRLADPETRAHVKRRLATAQDYNNIVDLVGWENIYLTTLTCPENRALIGLSVAEAAEKLGKEPADCAFDLLIAEHGHIAMVDFINHESDIAAILQSDAVSVISDSTYPLGGKPHPRLYGTFVRIIEKYVFADGVLTLPQAVRRMTSAPAEALRLKGKGRIAPGYDADIAVFDPAALRERGAYTDPARFPDGMDTVVVGGRIALQHGLLTGADSGAVIRKR